MTNIGGQANVALAEAIARWAHTGQVDKNGYDYIDHPKAVFYRVFADDAEDYDGQIAAWLHDVIEDTSVTLLNLDDFFPSHIVSAVDAITFRAEQKGGYVSSKVMNPWNMACEFYPCETRDEYYARVRANPIAFRVKLHDIAHNTSPKRMDKLDAKTRERLVKKYAHALVELTKPSEYDLGPTHAQIDESRVASGLGPIYKDAYFPVKN